MYREDLIEVIMEAVKRRGFAWHRDPMNAGRTVRGVSKANKRGLELNFTAVSKARLKSGFDKFTDPGSPPKELANAEHLSRYAPRSVKFKK